MKKFIGRFFLVIATFIQSIVGIIALVNIIQVTQNDGLFEDIFTSQNLAFLITALVLAVLITFCRIGITEEGPWIFFYILVDFLLSPIALLRVIFGFIFSDDGLCIDYADLTDFREKAMGFLFYKDDDRECEISRFQNFLLQLFVTLPLAALLSGSFWLIYFAFVNFDNGVFMLLTGVASLTITAEFFVETKTTTVSVYSGRSTHTRITHKKSGASFYARGSYTSKSSSWDTYTFESDDYHIFTPNSKVYYLFCILFSPIMVFTQLIGVLAAFLSLFIGCIHSSFGQVGYEDCPLPKLQFLNGFLCSFVIE